MKFQDEVTDALGEQVRRAVEVLIQALDRADVDRNRELLDGKEPRNFTKPALTVMMRIVFLLSAEERGLLLLGDERYEANYALSTLRMQLRKESEEILERRWDAWSRFTGDIPRCVWWHRTRRPAATGAGWLAVRPGSLPFLEGRAKGSNWHIDPAKPLPIDNRTVLLLLEAIQHFQGRTLSYRALDVGTDRLRLRGPAGTHRQAHRRGHTGTGRHQERQNPLGQVGRAGIRAPATAPRRLAELLQERSGSSASRVRNDWTKPIDDASADRLLTACHGDTNLRDRIKH